MKSVPCTRLSSVCPYAAHEGQLNALKVLGDDRDEPLALDVTALIWLSVIVFQMMKANDFLRRLEDVLQDTNELLRRGPDALWESNLNVVSRDDASRAAPGFRILLKPHRTVQTW